MSSLTIGEVAALAGIQTSAIRYYERIELVPPAARVSGQRRYDDEAVRRLVFIGMLQQSGLTLADIREVLCADDVQGWKEVVEGRLRAIREEIDLLVERSARLTAALSCGHDQPLTTCSVAASLIDARTASGRR